MRVIYVGVWQTGAGLQNISKRWFTWLNVADRLLSLLTCVQWSEKQIVTICRVVPLFIAVGNSWLAATGCQNAPSKPATSSQSHSSWVFCLDNPVIVPCPSIGSSARSQTAEFSAEPSNLLLQQNFHFPQNFTKFFVNWPKGLLGYYLPNALAALDRLYKMLSRDAENSATCDPVGTQLTNTISRVWYYRSLYARMQQ